MMHRFKDILVATSPGHLEPGVLRAAVKLAETNDAGLTVLDVVEPITRMRRFTPVRRATADAQAELVRQRSERLHRLARDAQASDDTDVKVSVGRPFIEVIRHVLEHDNDLVIVGDPKVERQGMPEFPSGVMHLLRKCPVPVWVMRPPQPGTFRILALIDSDSDDPVRDGLNGRVLALATSLARCEAGELHVAHALERAGEPTSQPSPDVRLPGEVTDRPADSADGVREERLGSLLEAHGVADSGAEVHLVVGHAGEVLPKLAGDLSAELIVMGTVARTGISGLIIGNTAETILRSVHCSVLAVKPHDFVAPVRLAAEMVT